jgi:hypothetical protein
MVRGESRQFPIVKFSGTPGTRLISYCYAFGRTNSALLASLPSGRSGLPGLPSTLASLESGSPCLCPANSELGGL